MDDPEVEDVPGTMQVRPGEIPGAGPPASDEFDNVITALPTQRSAAPIMATVRPEDPTASASLSLSRPPQMPVARYELGLEIARGGMGRVVEASDTLLGRNVALKEALAFDDDSLKRFAREIRITARLEHPSIVPVHDAGTSPDGAPFYVMRKVEGKPLEKLVAETATLSERLALIPHIVAASNAIAHAHERGIVHRDIKPANILVGELGETIVIDWGLAKVIGETEERVVALVPPRRARPPTLAEESDTIKTRAGIVYGTPGFMAPEQLRGTLADERCDVYALGATLYHMLLRRPPHHAKTADEMMRAAVDGPAKSLIDVIEGVPPDLSTIVDKALAFDATDRYQNARALAADLERFLRGQLIAAHHYSRGERARRFWRQHRVPIIAISLAATAALVVGVVSIANVIRERDRAHQAQLVAEQARAEAEAGYAREVLGDARAQIDKNPTLAVAKIKRLARGVHWREVRDFGDGARFAGVAWRAEASAMTTAMELAKDGLHALTAGNDGAIRIYDLANHTAAKIYDVHAPVHARYTEDNTHVVVYNEKSVTALDLAGAHPRTFALPTAVRDLAAVENFVYYVDAVGALWQLDVIAGVVPRRIATEEALHGLAASPDGRWIALLGNSHLWVMSCCLADAPIRTRRMGDLDGNVVQVAWSKDSKQLSAEINGSLITIPDIELSRVEAHPMGERYALVISDHRVYSLGPLGIATSSDGEPLERRKDLAPLNLGIYEARRATVIAASANAIQVLSDEGDRTIPVPAPRIDRVLAAPQSRYILVASEGSLLVWNLDVIQGAPRIATADHARFLGNDRALLLDLEHSDSVLDLTAPTEATEVVAAEGAIRELATSPSGKTSVVVDVTHHARAIGAVTAALDGQVDHVTMLDETRVLLARPTGTIELLELVTRQRKTLVERGGTITSLSVNRASPVELAVAYEDGLVWRTNTGSNAKAQLALAKRLSGPVRLDDDGTVWLAIGGELSAWRPGAEAIAHLATLPKPIATFELYGTDLVAITEDDVAYRVDLTKADTFARLAQLSQRHAIAAKAGLIVTTEGSKLDLIDPLTAARWTVAIANEGTFRDPGITGDGRRVAALVGNTAMIWSLDLPQTPEATAQGLDALTNAYETSTGELAWK